MSQEGIQRKKLVAKQQVEGDASGEDSSEDEVMSPHALPPPPGAQVPPHSFKVHFHRRTLDIRVDLIKVPEQHVTVNATEGEIQVDTLKFSKKFFLKCAHQNRFYFVFTLY